MSDIQNKTNEELSFELIWHAGNSKSCSMEAINAIDNGDEELVNNKLKEAREELNEAHQIQTLMLQDFSKGKEFIVDILMVHAQDHLNGAMLTYDFAKQIISLKKEIKVLRNEKK